MYKLRNIARRGTMFVGAGALLFASFASGSSAFADALNPLTHRSLSLSSSSPGWSYTDGSGNNTSSQPTPSPYAVPNSGANGQKTGNTFSFNVSSDSSSTPVKAFTFQYCTTSAGDCYAPGNNTHDSSAGTRGADSVANRQSDFNVTTATPTELPSADYGSFITTGVVTRMVPADNSKGNFVVLWNNAGNWQQSTGWTMTASNVESGSHTIADGFRTGKKNFITLTNTSGLASHAGDAVKVIFFGTNTNYITNPGQGSFFVKINDYNSATTIDNTTLVDGGVTVANVMNQSIQITTKVLETMDFSVGTVDPYTLSSTDGAANTQSSLQKAMGVAATSTANVTKHGTCDRILMGIDASKVAEQNVLQLGDTTAEDSLSTAHTYSTHSYWRLSSNSSAGATVYYSGSTLSNTVGDQIAAINPTNNGVKAAPILGSAQFGLALANGTAAANPQPFNGTGSGAGAFAVDYNVERDSGSSTFYENGADNDTNGIHASTTTDVGSNASYHAPRLWPLIPATNYEAGAGSVNSSFPGAASSSVDTQFAFDVESNKIPTPIASEATQVVDCVTGKMRYIANIAATTPAGIYTTKINYIAAPQY